MVTKGRLPMLKKSIAYFLEQSWKHKELVVVNDGPMDVQKEIASYIDELKRSDIRCVFLARVHSVGYLRNVSVESAKGEVLCQWDDDDYYHPRRLESQFACMEQNSAEACFLYDQLHYFTDTNELFWTDWSFQRSDHMDAGAPGTLMCRRRVLPKYIPEGKGSSLGEDAIVQIELYRTSKVIGLKDHGFLYTYVYHGMNSFARDHHRMIVDWMSFPNSWVEARVEELTRRLLEYFPSRITSVSCRGGIKLPLRARPSPPC